MKRALKRLEMRAASIATRHIRAEHVDGALASLARGLNRTFPDDDQLAQVHPDELDNDVIDQHMRLHAANHPGRAVVQPEAQQSPNLARAQDLAAPWSTGTVTQVVK